MRCNHSLSDFFDFNSDSVKYMNCQHQQTIVLLNDSIESEIIETIGNTFQGFKAGDKGIGALIIFGVVGLEDYMAVPA